ncbi:carboxy terminal-processing peptidase [Mucilaginibacter myungsuensis]|nr:carboxy terminal-processing peptidase [Mucilaginibacter myungsuensis]MDN3597289.1 carboxy terminal-processing peptidase [Mucilaginibacter myungsuensis]
MFKRLYIALLLGSAFACTAASEKLPEKKPIVKVKGSNDIEPDEQQSVAVRAVTQFITNLNYKKVPLNDSISALVFDKYLKRLDENHNYLLASDVKEFEKFRTVLDDDMREGNLNDVFYIFNVYQKRYNERVNYSLAQVDKVFDFNKTENFTYDRSKMPWVATVTDMDELWNKRVKYDLLNLKLAKADMAANRESLKKRYKDLLSNSNKLNNQDVFQIYMDAFTETIDPHTNYFNPSNAANFNIDMSRSLEGIGATLQSENEYVTIKSVVAGGPADKSKQLEIGDRIVAVAQGKDGKFSEVIGWRIENAIALIRGSKGTMVRLMILPKGKGTTDKPRELALVREKIILKDQSAQKEIRTYNNNGKQVKIGIISVPAFYLDFADYRAGNPNYKSTTRDVRLILDTLKKEGVDGVVMDLRQNGGGSLIEAVELTGLFIKTGPVVQVRDTRKTDVEEDEDPNIAWNGPLAVMVDRFSASASEIFSGAIQDYGRGIIVGSQTYGKGTVQNAIDLDKQIPQEIKNQLAALKKNDTKIVANAPGSQNMFGQLNLTVAKFYRVSGSSTQHKGVMPDIKFPSIIPMDKYGEDTEPSALPFDMIAKSNYTPVGSVATVLPKLAKLHNDRMAKNDNYKYMLADIQEYKKRDAETTVSLNEATLKKQRDEDEKTAFERVNLKRVASGFPALKKGDIAKEVDKKAGKKPSDLDFLKIEAGQILTDYIALDPNYAATVKQQIMQ